MIRNLRISKVLKKNNDNDCEYEIEKAVNDEVMIKMLDDKRSRSDKKSKRERR